MICCEQLTKVGLAQKEKRDVELSVFKSSYSKACDKNQLMSVKKIEEFEEKLSKVVCRVGWVAWRNPVAGVCEVCCFPCCFSSAG